MTTANNNNSDLRSSLHRTLTDFGPSVRPSLVAAQQQQESFQKRKPLLVGATASQQAEDDIRNNSSAGVESLQSLVAALSFSPKEDDKENAAPPSTLSTNKSKKSQKFTFETPQKTTPPSWVLQRTSGNHQPKTPLTVSTLGEEDKEEALVKDRDDESTTPTEAPGLTPSVTDNVFSPPAATRRRSKNSMDAVALAYPLSLPIEQDTPSTVSSSSTTTTTTKSVRKYPTVDTNIPGAGTRRSSVNQVKTLSSGSSSRRTSFRSITSRRSSSSRALNDRSLPAQHVYQEFKDLWAWSKQHVPVAPLVMTLAEHVVCGIAPHENLTDLDQQVATPLVAALDEHVVGPVVQSVCHVWQGFFGTNHNSSSEENA